VPNVVISIGTAFVPTVATVMGTAFPLSSFELLASWDLPEHDAMRQHMPAAMITNIMTIFFMNSPGIVFPMQEPFLIFLNHMFHLTLAFSLWEIMKNDLACQGEWTTKDTLLHVILHLIEKQGCVDNRKNCYAQGRNISCFHYA
jgi:hypothetical protein